MVMAVLLVLACAGANQRDDCHPLDIGFAAVANSEQVATAVQTSGQHILVNNRLSGPTHACCCGMVAVGH